MERYEGDFLITRRENWILRRRVHRRIAANKAEEMLAHGRSHPSRRRGNFGPETLYTMDGEEARVVEESEVDYIIGKHLGGNL